LKRSLFNFLPALDWRRASNPAHSRPKRSISELASTGSFGHHEVVHELLFEEKWIPLSAWLNRLERTGFAIVIVETNRPEWVRQNLDSIIITPMDD
jgi:hypothetical protein